MNRSLLALTSLLVMLCACGSGSAARPAAPAVALINDRPIALSEYQQYVRYAGDFYAATGQGQCGASGSGCPVLQRQVLRRLLEEQVVEQYAHDHGINLSPAEWRRVAAQLAVLASPGTPTGELLARREITRAFLRSVLADELLVQNVEQAVIPASLDRGQSYRLRIVTIPFGAGGEKAARQEALDLATTGGAAPAGATDRTEWVAAFRLGLAVRHLLTQAQIGQYVGPFRRAGDFRDFQLLGERVGRYGRPARQRLNADFFRRWIDDRLRAAHPTCYAGSTRTPCPGANA